MPELHKLAAYYIDDPDITKQVKEEVPAGELLIPAVVLTGEQSNQFLGIPSFNHCSIAIVTEVADNQEVEELGNQLKGHFQGLPRDYLETMMVQTLVAASGLPSGTLVRTFVNSNSAKLQLLDDDSKLIPVWDDLTPR